MRYPGPPPPPYYGPPHHWPPPPGPHYPPPGHHHPPPGHPHPPPPPPFDGGHSHPPPPPPFGPGYYMPTMMVPVAMPGMPGTPAGDGSNPTYITNYIYHGGEPSTSSTPAIENTPQIAELSADYDWVPSTSTTAAVNLAGRAVVGGHEGWDGSPLWIIRAWHNGDLIPGKFSVRHNAASVVYNGKEVQVQNIEVLISKPESLQWVPASNGGIPPGAVSGGKTSTGETLYVGRARHQLSVTPGKIHPSHNCCYIAFAGQEVSHKMYDVLCRV